MKLVFISDTHRKHRELTIPQCDVLVHSGDITSHGEMYTVRDFNLWLGELIANNIIKHAVVIAGNHDFSFDEPPVGTGQNAHTCLTNAIYLRDSGTEIDRFKFWGSPYTPRFFDWSFNSDRGGDIKQHWDLIPMDINILITHGPPYGILDQTKRGPKVGCEELLKKVNEVQPHIHCFGHIHEDYGTTEIDGITFINASSCNLQYQITNKPILIEL